MRETGKMSVKESPAGTEGLNSTMKRPHKPS